VAAGREDAALHALKGERLSSAVAERDGGDLGEGQAVAGPAHEVLADDPGPERRRI